ncbi:MAG: phosphate/phosphite/phosphonate ABC transporter substrate-binding protein [Planctomycetes bacterium]|nr:phosphate/phosphite/phosphonate ABC transporter substrate-binding protein [Planctomycetota bacterium]
MKLLLLALVALLPLQQRGPTPVSRPTEDPSRSTLSLSFGVYQSDKATVMYRKMTPVLEYLQEDLERRLGRPTDIHLSIFKSYDDGIDALVKGEIDFVRFGPASYITAKAREPKLDLLAMEQENGQKRFKGVVIVKNDSPIQKLADLKGKRFAFGDPNSTIGRYLVQAELVKAGIHAVDLAGFKYLDRHDKVAAAVELGDFDAGAVMMATYEQANTKGTLRVLASFDNVTKPWVVRAGFDPAVQAALLESLKALQDPAVLKELKVSGFTSTSDEEYAFVRDGMKVADEFDKRPGS